MVEERTYYGTENFLKIARLGDIVRVTYDFVPTLFFGLIKMPSIKDTAVGRINSLDTSKIGIVMTYGDPVEGPPIPTDVEISHSTIESYVLTPREQMGKLLDEMQASREFSMAVE